MRTELKSTYIWNMGGKVVSTVHHINEDGSETHAVLAVAKPVHLSLVEDSPARNRVVKGEQLYGWNR